MGYKTTPRQRNNMRVAYEAAIEAIKSDAVRTADIDPDMPTDALPGTEAKILILAARYRKGVKDKKNSPCRLSIFHEHDAGSRVGRLGMDGRPSRKGGSVRLLLTPVEDRSSGLGD